MLKAVAKSTGFKLAAYFFVLAVALTLLTILVPWFYRMLVPAPPGAEALPGLTEAIGPPSAEMVQTVFETLLVGLLALLGALIFAMPVVWIYTVIMRQEGYDRAFVRMLTALPVVVAGVVQVVRGDLALAFAAIGIGLAAGTGSFTLAAAVSATFSTLAYMMWQLNIGSVEPSLGLSHGGVDLSEALVPGETQRAVVVGDDSRVKPVEGEDVDKLSKSIDRLADYVSADALRKKKKYNTLLLAYTEDPVEAGAMVEEVLERHTKRWVKVDVIDRGEELVALEYLLRLKKEVQVGVMIDELGCDPDAVIKAAELKPVKGLRKRLT